MQMIDQGVVFDALSAPTEACCCAFTSLLCMVDGTWLCTFKCGPRKLSAQDRLVLMRSVDEGRTWQRFGEGFETTFGGTPGSLTAGYLFEPAPGRLMMSLHWVDRSNPTLPLSNPVTSGVLPMKYLLVESNDAGHTWTPPREVSLAPHPGTNPTGAITRLRDGRLMLAYESWKDWDDVDGDQSANVKFSSDEGRTWSAPSTLAADSAGRLYFWDNHLDKDPRTGQLLAACWTHDATRGVDAPIHLVRAEPDGQTWSAPEPTGIAGQVTMPLFLEDGRVMLIYVHRHDPPSIRAVLSRDGGRSWPSDRALILYQGGGATQAGMGQSRSEAEYWMDMTRWTFGHPKAVRLPGNRVLVVYYAPPPGIDLSAYADGTVPTSICWACLDVGCAAQRSL